MSGCARRAPNAAIGGRQEDDEDEPPPKKGLFGGFGTQRVRAEPKAEPASNSPLKSLFGGKARLRAARLNLSCKGCRLTWPMRVMCCSACAEVEKRRKSPEHHVRQQAVSM